MGRDCVEGGPAQTYVGNGEAGVTESYEGYIITFYKNGRSATVQKPGEYGAAAIFDAGGSNQHDKLRLDARQFIDDELARLQKA